MRISTTILAAATAAGAAVLAAGPVAAAPIQTIVGTDSLSAPVEQIEYYRGGNYYYDTPYGYHSPQYLYRQRYGLHSKEYMRQVWRRRYAPDVYYADRYYYERPAVRYRYNYGYGY